MEVRILGPLAVWVADGTVTLPRGNARIVLATLALRHGKAVSRDRLIHNVWGPDAPPTAATQLHGLVSVLRRALPPGAIQTSDSGYLLAPAVVDIDLDRFQAALEQARAAARSGALDSAVTAYRDALGTWTGAALDGIDAPHLALEATRLDELRLAAIEEWAAIELTLGGHAAVASELAGLVRREPLRESLCGLLMLALYRSDRQADALEAFQLSRRALVDGLGVEPGPGLRQLHLRILSADPALSSGPPPSPLAPARAPESARGTATPMRPLAGGCARATAGRITVDSQEPNGPVTPAGQAPANGRTTVAGHAPPNGHATISEQAPADGYSRPGSPATTNSPATTHGPITANSPATTHAPITCPNLLPGSPPGPRFRPPAGMIVPPAQLLRDVADFTGRDAQVATLLGLLSETGSSAGRLAVITGPGGVGKTTLALHVAHRLAPVLPDGSLYVDLRGSTATPLRPDEVLERFLRGLGVPAADLPPDEQERAALFRSLLSRRAMVVVFDDAHDSAQVRPLLPGDATCAVLVTSRRRLDAIDGVQRLDLDEFDDGEAGALFDRIVGEQRAAAEPGARARVLRACAGLPLAVRIAATRLASRPVWSVSDLADRLTSARPLDALRLDDVAVGASIRLSYEQLDARAARLFRLFGRLSVETGNCSGVLATAALTGYPSPVAERALEHLVDVHLLESFGSGRYVFHDLVRAFAAEQPEPDEVPSKLRLLRWFLHSAAAAAGQLASPWPLPVLPPTPADLELPVFAGADDAIAWYHVERSNLRCAVRYAADEGHHTQAWQLLLLLTGFLDRLGQTTFWVDGHTLALTCARTAGDRDGEALALLGLGGAYARAGQPDRAGEYLRQAVDVSRVAGERRVERFALRLLDAG